MKENTRRILIHIYNCGYMAGHHDTVEGQYINIHPLDIETWHEEIVEELAKSLKVEEELGGGE